MQAIVLPPSQPTNNAPKSAKSSPVTQPLSTAVKPSFQHPTTAQRYKVTTAPNAPRPTSKDVGGKRPASALVEKSSSPNAVPVEKRPKQAPRLDQDPRVKRGEAVVVSGGAGGDILVPTGKAPLSRQARLPRLRMSRLLPARHRLLLLWRLLLARHQLRPARNRLLWLWRLLPASHRLRPARPRLLWLLRLLLARHRLRSARHRLLWLLRLLPASHRLSPARNRLRPARHRRLWLWQLLQSRHRLLQLLRLL